MQPQGRPGTLPIVAILTLASLASAVARAQTSASVQPSAGSAAPAQIDPILWSDLRPVAGIVAARAQIVRTWTESTPAGEYSRTILTGDVRLAIGETPLRARRAVLWYRPRTMPEGSAIEIFGHLEDVGAPEDPASASGLRGKVLPVRAIVLDADGVQLASDLALEGMPGRGDEDAISLLTRADASLDRSLKKRRGVATDEPLPPAPIFRPASPPRPLPEKPERATTARSTPPRDGAQAAPQDGAQSPSRTPRERATSQPSRPAERPTEPTPRSLPTPGESRPSATPSEPGPIATAPRDQGQPIAPPTQPSERANQQAAQPSPQPSQQPSGPTPPTAEGPSTTLPEGVTGAPIFASGGTLALSPKDVQFTSGPDENAIIATGGVSLQYLSPTDGRVLQMTAQRVVVFLNPGPIQQSLSLGVDAVRGIYLEGDVTASDGQSTLRAPRVYYDLRVNKAVMLDAVFWVYDEQRSLPLYVRAKAIRQESTTQWTADQARFTTSALLDPELAMGTSSVTITRRDRTVEQSPLDRGTPPQVATENYVEARGLTLRAAGLPVFWWPGYAGNPENRLIRDIRLEQSTENGISFLSTLDAKALLGIERPELRADLLLDLYSGRGLGLGTRLRWEKDDSRGGLIAYGLPSDTGTDLLAPGTKIDQDGNFRGLILADQRWKIDDKWTILAEASYISDENFTQAFFPDLARTRHEFTNRLMARRLEANTALSVEASGTFNDFLANQWQLQSRGYSVTKLPEVFYARVADDLLPFSAPGQLTWTSEYRAGRYALAFDEVLARDRGYTFDAISQRAFGLTPDQSIGSSLRAQGLGEDPLFRLDTRQEVSFQASAGPVNIQPFVVGRITAYDDSFEQFSPDQDEQLRTWGAAGVRLSTTLQRVYDDVSLPALDIHRLRHIIEPNATFWAAATNIDAEDLPIYDERVESLADGPMARIGVTQILQTERGGPGRERSVDLFTLRTDIFFASNEAPRESSIGRWIDFRPELSSPGDFFVADAALRLTDATSLTGAWVQDLEDGDMALGSVGVLINQFPGFITSVDLRRLREQDSTYLLFGVAYELTTTYGLAFGTDYDLENSVLQSTSLEIRRKFATVMLGVGVTRNEITEETSFGFSIQPFGAQGKAGLTGIGGSGGTGDRLGI
jgi:hypothetical protein